MQTLSLTPTRGPTAVLKARSKLGDAFVANLGKRVNRAPLIRRPEERFRRAPLKNFYFVPERRLCRVLVYIPNHYYNYGQKLGKKSTPLTPLTRSLSSLSLSSLSLARSLHSLTTFSMAAAREALLPCCPPSPPPPPPPTPATPPFSGLCVNKNSGAKWLTDVSDLFGVIDESS